MRVVIEKLSDQQSHLLLEVLFKVARENKWKKLEFWFDFEDESRVGIEKEEVE